MQIKICFCCGFRDIIYKIISKPGGKTKTELVTLTVKRTALFSPYQDVLEFDFKQPSFVKKLKKTGPAFVALRVLQAFRDRFVRDPDYKNREDDLKNLFEIRDEIAAGLVADEYFLNIFAQISSTAAIVGGELAQDVIKAVSRKKAPHNNIFLFDPETRCGFIEQI